MTHQLRFLRLVTCLTLLKHHTSLIKTTRSHLYDKKQGFFVKPVKQITDLKSSDQELTLISSERELRPFVGIFGILRCC